MRNPLNDLDVQGNTSAWMADQDYENAAGHKDRYRCPSCEELVEDHEFIHEMKVCWQCWEDRMGAGYADQDQCEYLKEDR